MEIVREKMRELKERSKNITQTINIPRGVKYKDN